MKQVKFLLTLCILIIVFITITCKEREFNNPFDTACPKELFTPSDFKAVQVEVSVKLSWIQPNKNISGFKIYRSISYGEKEEVAKIDKNNSEWFDINIGSAKKYGYEIFAYAGENLSNPAEATITTLPSVPSVTTSRVVTDITLNSAILGGNVTDDGGATVTERGICYNTVSNPTIDNKKAAMGSGTGDFSSTITGFTANTVYYAKAYATNSYGTSYGSELSFTTAHIVIPIVVTAEAENITKTSALLGGTVTSDGFAAVSSRGVCYNTAGNPTTANTKIAMGTGTGPFSGSASGLTSVTQYYL